MSCIFNKGDIVNVDLGKPPKQIKGHEQGLKRPCIVIKEFATLGLLIIVPCTTTFPKYSLYTFVKLDKGVGGLSYESYALCHQIRTISLERVESKIGELAKTDILKIHSVLTDLLEV